MSFSTSPTRQIEAGDTPGFDDDQVSRLMSIALINKGTACVMNNGLVTIALNTTGPGLTPVVPVETKDNSPQANLEIRVVGAGQKVALTLTTGPLNPGEYVELTGNAGELVEWAGTINNTRYARYIGKEAGIFARAGAPNYEESLSVGVIPDQILASGEVGWFELVEGSGV